VKDNVFLKQKKIPGSQDILGIHWWIHIEQRGALRQNVQTSRKSVASLPNTGKISFLKGMEIIVSQNLLISNEDV